MGLVELAQAATVVQGITSLGLFGAAVYSIIWVAKTFHHDVAKDKVYVAFQLKYLTPEQISASDDGLSRFAHWFTVFTGQGYQGILAPPERISCFLINLGPGLVVLAEVPYTVKIYDFRPISSGQRPTETFDGTFRFYHVSPGQTAPAINSITTTFFPYFSIEIGEPKVYDITGNLVTTPPEEKLTVKTLEFDNHILWDALRQQKQAASEQPIQAPPQLRSGKT